MPSLYVKSFDSCVNRKCSLHSGLQLSWLFRIPCGVWPSLWNWKKVRVPVFSDNLKILVSVSGTVCSNVSTYNDREYLFRVKIFMSFIYNVVFFFRYDYLEFTDSNGTKRRFDQKVGTEKWPKVMHHIFFLLYTGTLCDYFLTNVLSNLDGIKQHKTLNYFTFISVYFTRAICLPLSYLLLMNIFCFYYFVCSS